MESAADYQVPPEMLLAIIKVESGGRALSHVNRNGSIDLGITMINDRAWLPKLWREYGVRPEAVHDNPCQAIRATAYIVRVETNACGGDVWCGIGRYHSRTPSHLMDYVARVWRAYTNIVQTGRF
ncbi:lytic transglycosylase domain-containing protein [Burkholderia sp. BCC1996]|uniref:lytic transglycosylase domain-containing protein n=1 Tax=unclassified Burkholderia TaxID=2613784 RepID=UPI0039EEAC7E